MMKKLIFCLLMLTGAGMLNSCQQEEIVNETPASKGVTIFASLPNNKQSRVVLEDTDENATQTNIYWQAGDEIIATIDGVEGYKFEILPNEEDKTTAAFRYMENKGELPTGQCIFAYGGYPEIGLQQEGTKVGLKAYHRMETSEIYITDWSHVSVQFSTKVALVEIKLPDTATKVSMYDANTNECLATTRVGSYSGKVYFSVSPNPSKNRKPLILVETTNTIYLVEMEQSKLMEAGKLYQIYKPMSTPSGISQVENTSVKYFTHNGTTFVYGQEDLPARVLKNKNFDKLIIVDGVKTIGLEAFYGCNLMNGVTIPASVNSIGIQAFYKCKFTSVTIPANVASIDQQAFDACPNGCVITVKCTVPPTLGIKAFANHNDAFKIYIPGIYIDNYRNKQGWGYYFEKEDIHIETF